MPHEWINGPKRKRRKNQPEPKTLFRQISNKELLELYRTIGYDPEAEHKPKESPQTVIHNVLEEEDNNKPHNGGVKTEPGLPENRPKVKTVVSDVLTGSGIS